MNRVLFLAVLVLGVAASAARGASLPRSADAAFSLRVFTMMGTFGGVYEFHYCDDAGAFNGPGYYCSQVMQGNPVWGFVPPPSTSPVSGYLYSTGEPAALEFTGTILPSGGGFTVTSIATAAGGFDSAVVGSVPIPESAQTSLLLAFLVGVMTWHTFERSFRRSSVEF